MIANVQARFIISHSKMLFYSINDVFTLNFTDHSKNKKLQDYMSSYNREVMMSEYVSIPKSRLRRLIITEVVAWGIAGFVLLVSLIR